MANITDSDYGTEQVIDTFDGPVTVVSQGFPVTIMANNQYTARKIAAEYRGRGYRANHGNPVWVPAEVAAEVTATIAAAHAVKVAAAEEAVADDTAEKVAWFNFQLALAKGQIAEVVAD